MIRDRRADHFHAADFAVFNQECLRYQDTGRPVETLELVRAAIRENPLAYSALIEYGVSPYDPSLLVDNRIAAVMDILDYEIDA